MSWLVRPDAVSQISSRWKISLFLAIIVNSLQISAFITYIVSVVPMYTVPVTGVLFSRTPCQFHIWMSFASISIWIIAITFSEHRFQMSIDSRRNGLWSPATDHPNNRTTGSVTNVRETGAWKADYVYGRGDTAAVSLSSSLYFMRLDSYGSVSKSSPPNVSLVNAKASSTATFGRGMLSSLILKFENVVFNVCAKEVGRIQSSSILRVLFVASSALASILAFSTLLSPKVQSIYFYFKANLLNASYLYLICAELLWILNFCYR